ncbi:MAG TPA: HAD-IA family hydrolase [Frankiaceae bacterium]|nr:HAD-IA family hydrolase [Frankiaceae bacterium]
MPPAAPKVDTVTYDFWNTLCYEDRGHLRGRRLDAWSGLLEEAGYATERAVLDQAFDRSWQRFVARWTSGQHLAFAEAAEEIVEDLGYDVPPDVRAKLVDAFGRSGDDAEIHLAPNVAPTLRALKDAGLRLGIVCDVGMTPSTTLRAHLDRHGVLALFDHWSFSDEVGHYKPDPRIFTHALDGLGARPETTLHIGDLRRTDVAGARAMGMTAVRYTGLFDDDSQPEPEGDHVLCDHRDLLQVLGIGQGDASGTIPTAP